jgi:hypothetical protein
MRVLKLLRIACTLVGALALVGASQAQASLIQLDFTGLNDLVFDGSTDSFSFGSPSIDVGGLDGTITGAFTIGAITTSGPSQSASVSGSGTLSIDDGLGNFFTATVAWSGITTFSTPFGGFGAINPSALLNVTGISYAGSNPDLLGILANGGASIGVVFDLSGGVGLDDLTADGTTTSVGFDGNVLSTPEPMSFALFGAGLGMCAAPWGVRRLRRRSSLSATATTQV